MRAIRELFLYAINQYNDWPKAWRRLVDNNYASLQIPDETTFKKVWLINQNSEHQALEEIN